NDGSILPPLIYLWESRSNTGSTLVKHLPKGQRPCAVNARPPDAGAHTFHVVFLFLLSPQSAKNPDCNAPRGYRHRPTADRGTDTRLSTSKGSSSPWRSLGSSGMLGYGPIHAAHTSWRAPYATQGVSRQLFSARSRPTDHGGVGALPPERRVGFQRGAS